MEEASATCLKRIHDVEAKMSKRKILHSAMDALKHFSVNKNLVSLLYLNEAPFFTFPCFFGNESPILILGVGKHSSLVMFRV